MQALNRKIAGLIPGDQMTQFADDVEIAKIQVQAATKSGEVESFAAWLRRAEQGTRLAEAKLKNAIEVDRHAPGTFAQWDIRADAR